MKIEKDELLNKWVVWFIDGPLMIDVYHSKLKKDCINFVNKNRKRYRK